MAANLCLRPSGSISKCRVPGTENAGSFYNWVLFHIVMQYGKLQYSQRLLAILRDMNISMRIKRCNELLVNVASSVKSYISDVTIFMAYLLNHILSDTS